MSNSKLTPCPDGGECRKEGDTCGDPVCVKWKRDNDAAGSCKCTFAQRMVGDRCDVCNPNYSYE